MMTHHATLEWLRPAELTVLPHLQRKLNTTRAKKMAADWDKGLVGVLEGARMSDGGDEVIHLIDGQTRSAAGMIFGEANGAEVVLPVVVYEDLDHTDVARLFLARNQLSSKVSAFDQYVVGLEAKDETALTIERAFNSTKFGISRAASAYEVAAVGAVLAITRKAIKQHDAACAEALLVDTLEVIHDAWPLEEADRVNGDMIKSISWMLDEYDEVPDKGRNRFVKVLRSRPPREWAVEARQAEQRAFSSGARYKSIVRLWATAYNEDIDKARPKVEELTV